MEDSDDPGQAEAQQPDTPSPGTGEASSSEPGKGAPESSEDGTQLGLDGFSEQVQDDGLSLDALSDAYAQLIDGGEVPYREPEEPADEEQPASEEAADAPSDCDVTPASIVEAMLFVGHPEGAPLTTTQIAALMRGVRPQEIPDLVEQLNEEYDAEGSPYFIDSQGEGYVLRLQDRYSRLRDRFYGKVREARLSQAAIDVLAIVAYKQPLQKDQIEELRGAPSGAILSQLVRRQLLQIERTEERPRKTFYSTSDRFLDLFGLGSVDELPQAHDTD